MGHWHCDNAPSPTAPPLLAPTYDEVYQKHAAETVQKTRRNAL